ncbi:hypothetical protein [Methylotenera sp.]|uniref:hypothetical protein n=1 Tax=Methylotenera sp. TaxID=2051956 RepID=UPI002488336C|nr:hypothetical protein [Methylotenera sp.]MDI1362546.1 hypothetical protein [Methylotenera sp.]
MTPEEMQTVIGRCGCGRPVRYQTHTGLACNKIGRCEHVLEDAQTEGFQRDNLPRIAIIGCDYGHEELRMMVTDRMHGVCEVISDVHVSQSKTLRVMLNDSLSAAMLIAIQSRGFWEDTVPPITTNVVHKGGSKRKRNPGRWR